MAELNNTGSGQWSEIDASNTSPSPDGWPSGTFPNQVEPIGRSTMGAIKRFWDRINGTVTTTGSSNAYVYTPTSTSFPTALVAGEKYTFKANFTNTGAATLNINSLGATNLYKQTTSGPTALTGGEVVNNQFYVVMYDGTRFLIINSLPNAVVYPGQEITLPSASTVTLGSNSTNVIAISGTTGITSFGNSGNAATPIYFVRFTGILTLSYNATSLILPTSANITTAAGDTAIIEDLGSNNWKVVNYSRLSGAPLVTTGSTIPIGSISGYIPFSITGSNTTASLTVSAGQASDVNGSAFITSGSSISWSVSNGNAINGYQGGTTLPNSSTIHFHACSGTSGTGIFASLSPNAPTLPSGYSTYFRRIFSILTNSSGALVQYGAPVEAEGGSLIFYLPTQVLDVAGAAPGSGSRVLYPLSVPTGMKVQPFIRANTVTGNGNFLLTSPDETDVPLPGGGGTQWSAAPGEDINVSGSVLDVGGNINSGILTTNTSAQIGIRSSNTAQIYVVTRGWKDFRR